MKTFIVALCLLALIVGFVVWNTMDLHRIFDEMIAIAEALPVNADEFEKDAENDVRVDELYRLWDKNFSRIAFTGGYENINRADEALCALFVHYQNDNAKDFTHARLIFWDSLQRMRTLEGFGLESIL